MIYDGTTIKAWAGDSQWRAWQADLARYRAHGYSGLGSEGFWAISIYRAQRALRPGPAWLTLMPRIFLALGKKMLTLVTQINLHPQADIGPGLLIPHVGPVQVCPGAKIGADCAIHHVCTIGAGAKPGAPTIADHVMIGCHSCVLGPVTIGPGAKIGAGAVVVTDIPAGATAVGVPAGAIGSASDVSPAVRPVDEPATSDGRFPPYLGLRGIARSTETI